MTETATHQIPAHPPGKVSMDKPATDSTEQRQPTPEELMAEAMSMSPDLEDETTTTGTKVGGARAGDTMVGGFPPVAGGLSGQVVSPFPKSAADSAVVAAERVRANALGVTSLATGIASFFVIPVLGAVIAVVTGHLSLGRIKRGELDGSVVPPRIGLALGYVQLALSLLTAVISILAIVLGISIFGSWLGNLFG